MKLTNKQIKFLRAEAHSLNFVVQTGGKGLTESLLAEINSALKTHELIKIKINEDRDDREVMIKEIVNAEKCELVHSIGKVFVLFKRNTNNLRVELPKE